MVRPTLADMVLKMPRGAQVIYPKDLAAILMEADIAPGVRVLEAGVGSGALSMALLRAGASVVGYELREDFANRAHNNVVAMVGEGADYRVELRDVYEGIEERGLDRIVLDLPEPWRVIPHAEVALRSGGIICAYLPTINQTAQFRHALEESAFGMAGTLEVLHRTWHVEDRSVRPDHRMVGHTGFLTTARLLRPEELGSRPGGPSGGRRHRCLRRCRRSGTTTAHPAPARGSPTTGRPTRVPAAEGPGTGRAAVAGGRRSRLARWGESGEPFASLQWPTDIVDRDAKQALATAATERVVDALAKSALPAPGSVSGPVRRPS